MSTADKINKQLSAYLDGQLSDSEARQVEQALRADPALSRELEQLRQVRRLVRELPRELAPKDFVARVLAQAERQQLVSQASVQSERRPIQWVRHLATAAMILISLGIGGAIAITLIKTPDHTILPSAGVPAKPTTADRHIAKDMPQPEAIANRDGSAVDKKLDDALVNKMKGSEEFDRAAGPGTSAGDHLAALPAPASPSALMRSGEEKSAVAAGAGTGNLDFTPAPALPANTDGTLQNRLAIAAPGATTNSWNAPIDLADADNVEINTDNLEETRQAVETVLFNNSVRPLSEQEMAAATRVAKGTIPPTITNTSTVSRSGNLSRPGNNFYQVQRNGDSQVQIYAYVEPQQASSLEKDLNQLRARQQVSQNSSRQSQANNLGGMTVTGSDGTSLAGVTVSGRVATQPGALYLGGGGSGIVTTQPALAMHGAGSSAQDGPYDQSKQSIGRGAAGGRVLGEGVATAPAEAKAEPLNGGKLAAGGNGSLTVPEARRPGVYGEPIATSDSALSSSGRPDRASGAGGSLVVEDKAGALAAASRAARPTSAPAPGPAGVPGERLVGDVQATSAASGLSMVRGTAATQSFTIASGNTFTTTAPDGAVKFNNYQSSGGRAVLITLNGQSAFQNQAAARQQLPRPASQSAATPASQPATTQAK